MFYCNNRVGKGLIISRSLLDSFPRRFPILQKLYRHDKPGNAILFTLFPDSRTTAPRRRAAVVNVINSAHLLSDRGHAQRNTAPRAHTTVHEGTGEYPARVLCRVCSTHHAPRTRPLHTPLPTPHPMQANCCRYASTQLPPFIRGRQ